MRPSFIVAGVFATSIGISVTPILHSLVWAQGTPPSDQTAIPNATEATTGKQGTTGTLNGVARTVVMANYTIKAILVTITVESIDSPCFTIYAGTNRRSVGGWVAPIQSAKEWIDRK